MTVDQRTFDITDAIAQKLLNFTKNFNWGNGNTLPPTVAEYREDLIETAQTLDRNFPNTVDETAIIENAAKAYEAVYSQILLLKPPTNADEGFQAWWNKTHAKPYLSYPGVM